MRDLQRQKINSSQETKETKMGAVAKRSPQDTHFSFEVNLTLAS